MLAVSEHQIDGVSGRGYREFQGEKYWFWPTRGIYGSQVGGKTRLLHVEIYKAIHGEPSGRFKSGPVDGDICNLSPENWVLFRSERARKHQVQECNGVRFYWKPDGYYKADHHKHGGVTMHRYVWELHCGPIPNGFHIHHKDGDKSNNCIENLEILSPSDHSKHHGKENPWVGSEENKRQIVRAGEFAKAWHSSEEGRKWHSQNSIKAWENRKIYALNCAQCGKEFTTKVPSIAKFCHQNCKAKALRARRKDAGI